MALHEDGLTAQQIVTEYPSLSGPTDVYAALVYYADKDEVAADFAEDERLADESERERTEKAKQRPGQ